VGSKRRSGQLPRASARIKLDPETDEGGTGHLPSCRASSGSKCKLRLAFHSFRVLQSSFNERPWKFNVECIQITWGGEAERVEILQPYTLQGPFDSSSSVVGLFELKHLADSAGEE
jgi:hypothetical protein